MSYYALSCSGRSQSRKHGVSRLLNAKGERFRFIPIPATACHWPVGDRIGSASGRAVMVNGRDMVPSG